MNRRFALIAAVSIRRARPRNRPCPGQAGSPNARAAPAPPADPAKWVPPLKGEVTVDFIQGTRREGQGRDPDENQTPQHLEGLDRAALGRRDLVPQERDRLERRSTVTSSCSTLATSSSSPSARREKPDLDARNMLMFKHANGTVKPNKVTKLQRHRQSWRKDDASIRACMAIVSVFDSRGHVARQAGRLDSRKSPRRRALMRAAIDGLERRSRSIRHTGRAAGPSGRSSITSPTATSTPTAASSWR